jgi:hypothetical protein
MINIPHRLKNPRYPINNPPCCQSSPDRSNDDFKALTAAIQRQTDVSNRILSVTPPNPTPEPPIVSFSVFMPHPGQLGSFDVFTGIDISNFELP